MVFWYYTTSESGQKWEIYMGVDKFENEDLIKYGLSSDLWFHVDDLSSAHVYLVCPPGYSIYNIPPEVVHDCAQLVKANSIEGSKKSSVKVVYTPWENLRKTGDMATGQIGYHNSGSCKYMRVDKKNEVVNRVNKTKTEKPTSSIRERRDKAERDQRTAEKRIKRAQNMMEKERNAELEKKKQEEDDFAALFNNEQGKQSNKELTITAEEYERDFM